MIEVEGHKVDTDRLTDPIKFFTNVLDDDPWDTQIAIARALEQPRARVAVKGCHASSKTYGAAEFVLWFITRYKDAIAVTTAPTDRQVEKILWGEIHQARARSRLNVYQNATLAELRIRPNNYAIGFSTSKSDMGVRFQGFHAPHLLFVLDEAPGVPAFVMDAIEGAAAGGDVRILMIGNPSTPGGPFYEAFTSNRDSWKTFTIDAYDTPNFAQLRRMATGSADLAQYDPTVITALLRSLPLEHPAIADETRPYLVTPRWAKEKLYEWGEESPLWQWKVRGQFPLQAEDALISLEWLEKAAKPVMLPQDEAQLYCGIDVAAGGGDETVAIVRTKKGRIVAWGSWYGHSTGQVIDFLRPHKDRIKEINFDSAGPGEYFDRDLDHARFRGLTGVNVGESSKYPDRFRNLKAELYWQLREHFKAGEISGLTDELMISQLATLRFEINPRGQVEMESKEQMRKRGVRSPDRAEALMLCFANRTQAFIQFTAETVMRQQGAQKGDRTGGFNPEDFGFDPAELEEASQEILDQIAGARGGNKCPKCGQPLGATKTMNSDGKYYHPECVRGW